MWGEVIQLLIGLPVAAALLLLVPRRVSRAWAIWLLICLLAGSLQWIGQGIYKYYNPDRLYLFTKDNQLEFQHNQTGEITSVVVHHPPEECRASRGQQQFLSTAGSSLILGFAVLLLVLRSEPVAAAPTTVMTRAGYGVGISLQLFGLAILVGTMAAAVVHGRSEVNLLGVGVIASGYYVHRGSRVAGNWALAFMALLTILCLVFVCLIAFGETFAGIGPGEAPWAILIGLAAATWAAVNLWFTVRFLKQREAADQSTATDETPNPGSA